MTVQRVVQDCTEQDYKLTLVENTGVASTQWLSDPNFQGASIASVTANYTDAKIPGTEKFLAAVDKYAPGLRKSEQFSYSLF